LTGRQLYYMGQWCPKCTIHRSFRLEPARGPFRGAGDGHQQSYS